MMIDAFRIGQPVVTPGVVDVPDGNDILPGFDVDMNNVFAAFDIL